MSWVWYFQLKHLFQPVGLFITCYVAQYSTYFFNPSCSFIPSCSLIRDEGKFPSLFFYSILFAGQFPPCSFTGWFINNGPPCKCCNMGLLNCIALSFWKTKLNQQKNFCLTESWLIVPTYRETRKIPRISKLWLWIESLYKVVIKIPKSDYNVIIFFQKLQ